MDTTGPGSGSQAAKHRRGAKHAEGAAVLRQAKGKSSSIHCPSLWLAIAESFSTHLPSSGPVGSNNVSCMSSGSCGAVDFSLKRLIVIRTTYLVSGAVCEPSHSLCEISEMYCSSRPGRRWGLCRSEGPRIPTWPPITCHFIHHSDLC